MNYFLCHDFDLFYVMIMITEASLLLRVSSSVYGRWRANRKWFCPRLLSLYY